MPRPATLTPELLHTFVTLVQTEGNAAEAATILNINQPSMSKRLAYFQHAGRLIRQPWLERDGKTWNLTPEGRRVLPVVEDLLRRYDQMLGFVEMADAPTLTVACGQEAVGTLVLEALRRFRPDHEGRRFRLTTPRGNARIEGVANGLFDLALVTNPPDQIEEIARRPLAVEPLLDDPLVLICAADTRKKEEWMTEFEGLADGRVTPKALTQFPLILPEPDAGLRKELNACFRKADVLRKLNIILEVGGWNVILTYVREGVGVGFVPRSTLQAATKGFLVKTLPPALSPSNVVRAICRRKPGTDQRDLGEAGEQFLGALRDAAKAIQSASLKAK